MAKQTGLACALYTGGYDVGGDTQSFVIHGGPAAIDSTDITQSAFDRLGGLRTAEMNWVSYFDTAAGASHAALSPLPTADVISMALISPIAIGCPAVAQVSRQLSYDGTRAQAGEFTFAVPEQSDGYGQEWGVALTAGKRTDTAATNGTSYDFGAASASLGAQAYLQVFSFSGTDVTVSLEDSANNSSFSAVAGGAFTQTTTAPGAQRIATSSSLQIRRYVRAVTATSGGFSSLVFAVMICVNTVAVSF